MSFDTMFKVFDKNKPKDEDIEKIPSFIFCRWLAGNPQSIFVANNINLYSDMPVNAQFDYVHSSFKNKKLFIKYPKKEKDESFEIDILCKHYKLSPEKAKEYLLYINKEELKNIIELYKTK